MPEQLPTIFLRVGFPNPQNVALRSALSITGVTRDAVGALMPMSTVHCFRSSDDRIMDRNSSDGAGNYLVNPPDTTPYSVVAIHGATVDSIVPSVDELLPTAP